MHIVKMIHCFFYCVKQFNQFIVFEEHLPSFHCFKILRIAILPFVDQLRVERMYGRFLVRAKK